MLQERNPAVLPIDLTHLEPGFLPNCFVDVSEQLATKLEAAACYESQLAAAPGARSLEALEAQARWRGSQMGLAAAEAFVTVRLLR